MIIDFHAHIFTDNIAKTALPVLAERAKINPFTDATSSGLINSMRLAGIDYSVIANIATRMEQVPKINNWAIKLSSENSQIISLGTLHPQMSLIEIKQELTKLSANNIKGIKMHPDYQDFYVDDPVVFPMYEAIADSGLFILFHSGIDIGLPDEIHCTPSRLLNLREHKINVKIVAAHMGGYQMWDDVEKYLIGTNICLDTSFSVSELGSEKITQIIRNHGVSNILFGSDSPWKCQKTELELIKGLPLGEKDIDLITGYNAAKIFGIK
jgi:predicted TIM-barrel fold metal-dependent hydrolase